MDKAALLAAASVLALCAGNTSAAGAIKASFAHKSVTTQSPKGSKPLWYQNSNYAGENVASETFTSGVFTVYDSQGADDFVIPKGRTWTITEVDVTGAYSNEYYPAMSENVVFYKDDNGVPGKPVRNGTFANLNGSGSPNFAIRLPGMGLHLKSDTYWVSVVPNLSFSTSGTWGRAVNSVQNGHQAVWQNPDGGFGVCPTWNTLEDCLALSGDLMFDLRGMSRRH